MSTSEEGQVIDKIYWKNTENNQNFQLDVRLHERLY